MESRLNAATKYSQRLGAIKKTGGLWSSLGGPRTKKYGVFVGGLTLEVSPRSDEETLLCSPSSEGWDGKELQVSFKNNG